MASRALASGSSAPSAALIVEEVLATVLSPERRGELLGEALGMAALPAIPDGAGSLRVFVEGALFSTLARHLEVSDALELVGQIRSALELALDCMEEERPISDIHTRMSLPAGPQRVLVVSQASLVVFLLQDVVGDAVDVLPVSNTPALRDRLRRMAGQSLLVVVDRKHPCVGPGVCNLLRTELGPDSTVIWWGAHGAEREDITRRLRGGPQAITCEFDLRLSDLGELCQRLLQPAD